MSEESNLNPIELTDLGGVVGIGVAVVAVVVLLLVGVVLLVVGVVLLVVGVVVEVVVVGGLGLGLSVGGAGGRFTLDGGILVVIAGGAVVVDLGAVVTKTLSSQPANMFHWFQFN